MFERFNGSKWGLWICIILLPAIGVARSNKTAFPEALGIASLLLAISVGVSLYTTIKSDEPDKALRQWGLLVEGGLAVAIFFNLVCHFQLARETSAAQHNVAEKHVEEDREEKRKDADTRREIARREMRAKEIAALAEQQRVQTDLLRQLPTRKRNLAPSGIPPVTADEPEAATGPNLEFQEKTVEKKQIVTPEMIRESWNSTLMWLAAIEAFIAIVGGVILTIMRHWDGNGNGVPDWIERVAAKLSDADVRRVYPTFAEQIISGRQGAMGN